MADAKLMFLIPKGVYPFELCDVCLVKFSEFIYRQLSPTFHFQYHFHINA